MTDPSIAPPQPRSPWRPIGITLLATLTIAITFCGGGASLDGREFGAIAGILVALGTVSALVFLVTLLVAFILLLVDLFRGGSKP
jgi:hypothetical protein